MRQTWIVIISILLFVGAMLLLTFRIPEIRAFASSLASNKHLPLWFVGLFSPIVYLFKNMGDWVISSGTRDGGVIGRNQQIQTEQERIRRDLDSLLDWRSRMLQQEYESANRLKSEITLMEKQLASLGSQIRNIQSKSVEEFASSMSDPQKDDVFEQYFKEHGAAIYK